MNFMSINPRIKIKNKPIFFVIMPLKLLLIFCFYYFKFNLYLNNFYNIFNHIISFF